jgi:hypothetical protein
MTMMPRFFVRLAVLAVAALALAGCWGSESYRYKLTLAVNTPTGVKRGSSVVEVVFGAVSIPERGIMHKLRGQALYLDLGPGAKPLIALLTSHLHPKYGKDVRWTRDAGPGDNLLSQLYGPPLPDFMKNVSRIARLRGSREITPNDLPDLVTFADIYNPKSVIEVDANNLPAALGPGISWSEITLESTDEPITTGIAARLPWIPAYHHLMLDGDTSHLGYKNTLANTLSTFDFDQLGDSKGPSNMTTIVDLFLAIF